MKQRIWKRGAALALAAAMSFLQIPSGIATAQEPQPEACIVERDEPSGDGLQTIRFYDENGAEIHPDRMPAYGLRAGGLPSAYDLRTDGKGLPAVRSQTGTGTCWAHAALGSIESEMIEKGEATTDIDLSEAHLVWFANCMECSDPEDPLYCEGSSLGSAGYQRGGSYLTAIESLASWSGYEFEANPPPANNCPSFDEADRYHSQGHVQEMLQYDKTDQTAIKTAIMNTGAVYADFYSDDAYYSANKDYYCSSTDAEPNHAILIVGWDDDYAVSHFKTAPPSKGAWLCRNSWGESWNKSGYFYISYADATLGDFVSFHAEPTDNYDTIYQYDLNWGGWTVKPGSSYLCAGANIFNAKQDESVEAVSFYTVEASTGYTVQIYKNVNGKPNSGKLAAEISGTELYAGYHTIRLNKPVSVRKGSNFSVVLTLDKNGILFDQASSQTGVSFFGSARMRSGSLTYQSWSETLTIDGESINRNACIKAFTSSGITLDEENFPDPVVRDYAAGFDANGDGVLTDKEIAANTASSVSFAGTGLTNIQGLEIFRNIRELDLSGNPLAMLDVSEMDLTTLICSNCVVELGDAACTDINALGIDVRRISDLKGAVLGTRGFVPSDPTISYTYDCGDGFSAVFTLKADTLSHSFAAPVSQDEETHYQTCTDCGYRKTEAHTLGDWTDTKDGSHARTCEICGQTIREAHNFSGWTEKTATGHTHTCTVCGAVETAEHRYDKWTEDNDKTHSAVCADCGHALQEAHTFGSYIDGNDKSHLRYCSVCRYQEISSHRWNYVINKLRGDHSAICADCGRTLTEDHTYGDWIVNKDGTHSRTCTRCGFTETAAHDFGAYTRNADGTHTRTCKSCGYAETAAHSFGDYVQNKDGTHTHTCTACGFAETAAHSFGDYVPDKDGTHSHSCTVCGFTESDTHQFGTCKDADDGTHIHTCTLCGFAESASHTYGTKYTITKDAHTLTCTRCSHAETTAHVFGACTDNDNGTHSFVCEDCRYVKTSPHSFGAYTARDGVSVRTCADCGAEEMLPGDVTLDGIVDVRDVILLQKWLHGKAAKGTSTAGADLNGDGVVNIFDLALLKRVLLAKK